MSKNTLNKIPHEIKNFLLEKLLAKCQLGLFILGERKKIIFWGKAAKNITGYDEEETIGKKFSEITLIDLSPERKEGIEFEELLEPPFKKKNILKYKIYIRHKENYRFLILIKFYFISKYIVCVFNVLDIISSTKKLIVSLKKTANIDHITELPNRRSLEFLINKKISEFKRFNSMFGIILFDINNFKLINDKYGHGMGDKILIVFSKILKKNIRSCDTLGRWGGDEFVVVALNIEEEKLKKLCKKLKKVFDNKKIKDKSGNITFSVSAGYATIRKDDDIRTLIERADKMMYEDKRKTKK